MRTEQTIQKPITLPLKEISSQDSLTGTKRKKRGSLLPLTLLFAALVHAAVFYALDLRLPSEGKSGRIVDVDFIAVKKPAPAVIKQTAHEAPAPVKQAAVHRKPVKKAMKTAEKQAFKAPVQEVSAPAEAVSVPSPVPAHISAVKADIPTVSDTEGLKVKYRDVVREIIASNKKYPVTARRRGIQGSVTVAFMVQSDGVIADSSVRASSGYDILDRTAMEILAESSPLPVPPEEMDFVLPISFRLN